MLSNLLKTIGNIAVTPVDVVKDVCTFGGVFTDRRETYTGSRLKKVVKKAKDTADDIEDLLD